MGPTFEEKSAEMEKFLPEASYLKNQLKWRSFCLVDYHKLS